jgi:putative ABC transport system substrate-binding protein
MRKKVRGHFSEGASHVFGMRRREFVTLVGGAAAWPLAARAALASEASGQRGDSKLQSAMPVIGFLGPTSLDVFADRLRGFQRGLKEAGYVEGENVAILYRWAEGQFDHLPVMAAELVGRRVSVIATGATNAALAAKAATATIPVLFIVADDPVALGLVTSVARPGGNVTGVNLLSAEVASKRLEFLRELIPGAARVALLINPADANTSESILREVDTAARAIGLTIEVYRARTSAKSMRSLRLSRASGRTRFSSAPIRSLPAAASNWPTWPRAMRFPWHPRHARLPTSAA